MKMESHMQNNTSDNHNEDNNQENPLANDLIIMKAKKDTIEAEIKETLTNTPATEITDEQYKHLMKLNTEYDELAEKISKQEKQTNIQDAMEIMTSRQFIGPDDIEKTFGFKPESIPDIKFSKQELETAKQLGQQLILSIDALNDGTPLNAKTIKSLVKHQTKENSPVFFNQDWFETDSETKDSTPNLGWRLTTPEIIDNSTDKNHLEQTETLIEYLKDQVFKSEEIPEPYQTAIDEFESQKTQLTQLLESDWKKASEPISKLKINHLTRENYTETMYRLALIEKKTGVQNLENKYSWSNTVGSGRNLVGVGFFGSDGLVVDAWNPGDRYGHVGVCFSRSDL